jgi:hypothetical protein
VALEATLQLAHAQVDLIGATALAHARRSRGISYGSASRLGESLSEINDGDVLVRIPLH